MSGKVHHAKGLRIATRCESVDEFVEKFCRLCEGSLLFIPHAKRAVGGDTAFSFDLSDGRAALCGLGVVLEEFVSADNRFGRPGILIEIRQLQPDSRPVFEKMSAMQRAKRRATTQPRATTPPPAAPTQTLAAIPSYRSRAVTSAIEIVDAVALAKDTAPPKPGGLPKRTLPSMPIAVPKAIPSILRSGSLHHAIGDAERDKPTNRSASTEPVREAPAMKPVEAALRPEAPPLAAPPPRPDGSGAMFEEAVGTRRDGPDLAQSSGAILERAKALRAEDGPPPTQPFDATFETISELGREDVGGVAPRRPEHASPHAETPPAAPVDGPDDRKQSDQLAQAAVPIVAAERSSIEQRPPRRARLRAAVRSFTRELDTRSRIVIRTVVRGWNALSLRRQWLVGAGAGSIVVALTLLVITIGSKTPSPRPPPPAGHAPAFLAGTDETANPTADSAPAKKRPVVKKKRVATKRVATKTAKKLIKKPIVKPAAKKPVVQPTPVF